MPGCDHALVGIHLRRRCICIIDGKLVRAGSQTGHGIEVIHHLEIVDVNVDRMLVVIVVDELPFLH